MSDTKKARKQPGELRSQQWFGRQDRDGFNYRSWVKGKGVPHDQFDGRPVIGICNTFSELTPCNSHFRTIAEQVKIGVYEAGGFPLEFPVMSLGETLLRPTAMLYRNLASMDVEESIRGNPLDGVVLLMGYFRSIPFELEECALIDGASRWEILTKIILPLAVPGLISAGIFAFTLSWNEFIYALTFISSSEIKTVPVGVVTELVEGDVYHWVPLMAGALLGSLPVAFIYSFFVEYYVSGLTGSVKE